MPMLNCHSYYVRNSFFGGVFFISVEMWNVNDIRIVQKRERLNQMPTNEFICPHQQESMTEVVRGSFFM